MRYASPTLRQKQARIPKLPNTPVVYDPPDQGAPLPAPDWANRFSMARTGTNPDGTPIIEAQAKPRPTT